MRLFQAVILGLVLAGAAVPAGAKTSQVTLRDRQQAACASDAQRLCGDTIPDAGKTEACMKGKRSQVSPGCAAMWDVKD